MDITLFPIDSEKIIMKIVKSGYILINEINEYLINHLIK